MPTTRHMDFDAARAESKTAVVDPVSFTLCGQEWSVQTDVAGALLMDFITSRTVSEQLRAGKDLLVLAIDVEQRTDFEDMLRFGRPASAARKANKELGQPARKAEPAIPAPSMEQLDTIVAWLVRELLGRPTTG